MIEIQQKSINEQVVFFKEKDIIVYVKREDRLHEEISGNKFRKLKYNLMEAQSLGYNTLLTFGGAYSNHIAAVAAAGKTYGFATIGVIRGEELKDIFLENPTLKKAAENGMNFKFVSRTEYRQKDQEYFIEELKKEYKDFYLIPEGGTNNLAVKGCEEILTEEDFIFDYICCAVGTGGTISGLINASSESQIILGFPVLKGDFLEAEIKKYAKKDNWSLVTDYHFGGYAKITPELKDFIHKFTLKYLIPLDPVYTAKVFYGIFDLIDKDRIKKGAKILVIHTGGLQGLKSNILL
ncbi:pyridoxal-phosphate dependent enzyme [Myroides ceti]|uniref:Pyridoxal-phosphate dependent enzyme n=1 Tax=Paenimyroides ceti TaxID=395087 RepID=A0ABT8CV22_9FLAO|nr:pyridoxal-phosphate dependent enzyme [Paenimyroides ceti]MDN3708275.1 pyridoxal-phosphate dependent enzyme [Paenimyroides ceti]MDN3709301.1 pyridoxal-phosphate dependent enzyme [Paenimyroides ceti]